MTSEDIKPDGTKLKDVTDQLSTIESKTSFQLNQMDKPLKVAIIGICLTVILGIIYFFLTIYHASANTVPPYTTLVIEAFKTLLTFSLITTGGVVLKAYINQILEIDRNKQTETNRYEETRKTILKEFTTIT